MAKSSDISRVVSIFYGTENEIWAGFGPVGSTEKKIFWANYEQLLRAVFLCFHGQKNLKKHCSVCTKNLHKIKVKRFEKKS